MLALLQSRITPLIDQLLPAMQSAPSILVVGALLLLFLILIQIMNVVRRIMLYPLRIAWWVAKWGVVIGLVAMFWERGWEQSIEDLGSAAAWARNVGEFWWEQYALYNERQNGNARLGTHGRNQGYGQRRQNVKGNNRGSWR
jgi:hypothetical protein